MQITRVTADALVRTGVGKLHTITIAPTQATPTAGVLTVYDSTTESGTTIYSEYVPATVAPHTVTLDCVVHAGIYVGFDGTLDGVQASVTHL